MRRNRQQRAFSRAIKKVILPVHSYWLNHNEKDLVLALQAIRDITQSSEVVDDLARTTTIRIEGWVPPQRWFHLDARSLRLHNPGYRLTVRRFTRSDVPLPWWLAWWCTGYVVQATGIGALPPFVFGVTGHDGALFEMTPSSVECVNSAKNLTMPPAISRVASRGRDVVGYIDSILYAAFSPEAGGLGWLAQLAGFYPREIFELVDSAEGHFLAAPLAELMGSQSQNLRWRDRFALSAGVTDQVLHSDLTALKVWRPASSTSYSGIKVPKFERTGAVARAVVGRQSLPSPSDEWLHLDNAVVQDGGIVLVGDELIVYEAAADPTLDFVSGLHPFIFGSRMNPNEVLVARRPSAERAIAEGILLSGRNDVNWYHWLIEYLPRVMQAHEVIDKNVPVIVASRTPRSGIDALRSLTDRPIIVIDADTSVSVALLHVVAPPVQVLDTTHVEWSSGIAINPRPLHAMRQAFRAENRLATRNIFLQRNSQHRGIANARAIETVARAHGLEVVDPSHLSWEEQKLLFSEARLVVGASGAVMANYLLMPDGSRVLAMTSESLDGFVLPAVIAQVAGVTFSYLFGKPTNRIGQFGHRRDWFHGDFEIGVKEFQRALRNELKHLDS